jgi:hypothetical protein
MAVAWCWWLRSAVEQEWTLVECRLVCPGPGRGTCNLRAGSGGSLELSFLPFGLGALDCGGACGRGALQVQGSYTPQNIG